MLSSSLMMALMMKRIRRDPRVNVIGAMRSFIRKVICGHWRLHHFATIALGRMGRSRLRLQFPLSLKPMLGLTAQCMTRVFPNLMGPPRNRFMTN